MDTKVDVMASAKEVLQTEAAAILGLIPHLDASFETAVELLLNCQGRIVVSGMGKSGHIGAKIAATLASTGSPAFFVHPGEAAHGDMGMITAQDVVIALSNSGETAEMLSLVPSLRRNQVATIAITGNPNSTLANFSDVHLTASVDKEACPLGLAPTASTTAAMAMGDALAVALLEVKGFGAEDFALSHPGGSLGKRLLLTVDQVMHQGSAIPRVSPTDSIQNTLLEMTRGRIGMTCVVNAQEELVGIFTDGDLRRVLSEQSEGVFDQTVSEWMTRTVTSIPISTLAAEALRMMEHKKINQMVVTDSHNKLLGVFNFHDLLNAGLG